MAFTPSTRAVISFVVDGVQSAQRQINSLSGSMDGLSEHITGSLKGIAAFAGVGLGLGAIAHQVMEAQREFDKLNSSLVTATGSTANAAQAFDALQAFAATTPYGVKEATEAFITMRNLGLDPSEKALRSYGNTAAAMGKDLNQMVEAVADAATGEFERLKEFGITASKNGSQVALTFQGMTTKVGNNTKEIQAYLQNLGNVNFAGAMEKRADTLDGAISNLGDTWSATMRTIAQNGIGEMMQSSVMAVASSLSDLSAILDAVAGSTKKEGEAVKESSVLHAALTTVFETVAVLGVNVAYVLTQVGKELGGLAAQAVAVAHGDLAGAKAIGVQMKAEAEQARKDVDAKSEAILGAAVKAQKAEADQAAERKKSGTDRLAGFAIELTADQKRAKAKQDIFEIENKLNGVNAETAGELVKLKAALDAGAISQAEYGKYVAKINKEAAENSTAYKDQVKQLDLSSAAIKRRAEAQALLNQREQEHVAFLRESGQLDEEGSIKRIAAAQVDDLKNQKDAVEAQLVLAKKKIDNKKEVADLAGQIGNLETKINNRRTKEEEDLFLLEQKRYRLAADNYADLVDKAGEETKVQKDALLAQQDEIAQLGMTEKQIAAVNAARLLDLAARADENALIADGLDLSGKMSAEYRTQADLLRQRASLTVYSAELKQQKELWSTIESTAHDTFVSIFDSGKSAFDRLRDTLKNGLLDLLYQMTIKKWIFNIGASVGLTGGVTDLAQAAGGSAAGTSSVSSLVSAAQTASNIYKAISGGFSAIGSTVADAVQVGMYETGLSTELLVNGTVAKGVGTIATAASAYMAGSALNAAISGKYSTGSGLMTAEKVATAVASYVNPVLGVAVGAISGLVNRAFGMGNTEVKSQGISGTLSASGLSGNSYQNLHQDGGWFRSDKNWTDKTAFSAEMTAQFTQGFAAIKTASAGFAASIGADASSLATYSKAFDIALTSDATANEKAITDFFTGVGDEIALRLVPGLAAFSKSGETMSTTLERLAGDFTTTNQVAMLMGKSGTSMFGSLGIDSAAARERLIDLAGGMSTLSAQASSFAQNYLTEAQRLAPVAEAVGAAMASLGLASITTRDQFAAHIDQLISSGAILQEAGAQEYTSLMALVDAFAQVHPAIESTTAAAKTAAEVLTERADLQKQLDQLTLSSSELLAQQRAALDESNRALFDQVQAAQAAKTANDAAKTSLGEFLTSTRSFADSVKGFNATLLTGSLSNLTPEQQLAEARRQFEQTKAAAIAGDSTARSSLQEIENTFLTLSQKINGGDAQYSSDLASVMQTNDQVAQWATSQADIAQASLDALNEQVSGIADLSTIMLSVAQSLQYLPTVAAAGTATTFTPVTLPTIDYSTYGTASQAPLLAAIKALQEEVKALRADAQQQAGDGISSNVAVTLQAADRIVDGTRQAASDAAYAAANASRAPS